MRGVACTEVRLASTDYFVWRICMESSVPLQLAYQMISHVCVPQVRVSPSSSRGVPVSARHARSIAGHLEGVFPYRASRRTKPLPPPPHLIYLRRAISEHLSQWLTLSRGAECLSAVRVPQFVNGDGALSGKLGLTQRAVAAKCVAGAKEAQRPEGIVGVRNRMFL